MASSWSVSKSRSCLHVTPVHRESPNAAHCSKLPAGLRVLRGSAGKAEEGCLNKIKMDAEKAAVDRMIFARK